MKKLLFVLIISVLLLSLAGCSSKEKDETQQCLIGTWQLIDNEAYARAILPPGAFDLESLRFNGGAGLLGYTFAEDGQATIQAYQWMAQFSVPVDSSLYELNLQMNGFAQGKYSVEGDILRMDSTQTSELSYQAVFDDEGMLDTFQADEFAPLFVPDYNQARFECSDTQLSLTMVNQPGFDQPLIFKKVEKEQE